MPSRGLTVSFKVEIDKNDYRPVPKQKHFSKHFKPVVTNEAKQVKKYYRDLILKKFKNSRHRVPIRVVSGSGNSPMGGKAIWAAAGTDGARTPEGRDKLGTPFIWLEEGFLRKRKMSADWQSKTRPGSLLVGPGKGTPINKWMAGVRVEPRNFRDAIIEKRQDIFYERCLKAWDDMFRDLGW